MHEPVDLGGYMSHCSALVGATQLHLSCTLRLHLAGLVAAQQALNPSTINHHAFVLGSSITTFRH